MKLFLLILGLISTANANEWNYGYPPGYYEHYPQMYYQINPYGYSFGFNYDYRPIRPIIVYPQYREYVEPRWRHEHHHHRHHRDFR